MPRRRHLVRRELVLERRVAEPASEDPAVRRLLPVVEAVPAVVRAVEEPFGERLGGDHLAARGHDQPLELAEEAARVAVGRDEHVLGLEPVERLDAAVLADLDAGLGGAARQAVAPSARAGARHRRDGRSPRGSGRRAAPRSTRRRSRPRGAPRTRRRARRAPRRRRRGGGCPSAAARRRPEPRAGRAPARSAATAGRWLAADRLDRDVVRAPRRRGARSRRSARSRRRRSRARREVAPSGPPRRARSAAAQPVTPPPTTTASGRPLRRRSRDRRRRLVQPVAGQRQQGGRAAHRHEGEVTDVPGSLDGVVGVDDPGRLDLEALRSRAARSPERHPSPSASRRTCTVRPTA